MINPKLTKVVDFNVNTEYHSTMNKTQQLIEKSKRNIWVTFTKEGIHCYPAAGTDPALNTAGEYDVSFLANPHRHLFHFKVWIEVFHDDRDIEFIQFKRWLEGLYGKDILQLDFKSCEMIADDLYNEINSKYPSRNVKISVAEDNENGCEVEYNTTQPLHNVVI